MIRLRELDLLDENIWKLIVKAGGALKTWPDPVEKKRAVLCEVNEFIARIMEKKKEACSNSGCAKFNQCAIA